MRKDPRLKYIYLIGSLMLAGLTFWFGNMSGYHIETTIEPLVKTNATKMILSEEQLPAILNSDLGSEEIIPTFEEIDGGQFEDVVTEEPKTSQYVDLGGKNGIEEVDTSSGLAFVEDTLGRCIIANNIYGAQCVSLARAFWFSYANRDVSTCGTDVAKGMMKCWEQNAGDDFKTIWSTDDIIPYTWGVFDGAYTGHVCFILGEPKNGYVTCLGENQGGKSCGEGIMGSATNIVNISIKNFIGGYIPKSYIPVPDAPDTGVPKE